MPGSMMHFLTSAVQACPKKRVVWSYYTNQLTSGAVYICFSLEDDDGGKEGSSRDRAHAWL